MPFVMLDELKQFEPVPGFRGRFVHSDHMTLADWTITAGAALPVHAHPHEQITRVLAGEFAFTLNGETRSMGPGAVVVIPPNATHTGKAITNCRVIDTFYPVREDYRDKTAHSTR